MSKISEYFYIFSKLTTSLVLMIVIIIMGYALYLSYKQADNTNIVLDNKFQAFSKILQNNEDLISNLNSKVLLTDNMIREISSKLNNIDNSNYQNEIQNLQNSITIIENQLNEFAFGNSSQNNEKKLSQDNDELEINKLKELILIKYMNGEVIDDEMLLLESFFLNTKNDIFEKLSILNLNKFYGINNLNKLFNISLSEYINEVFEKKNKSVIVDFLLKFVTIKPSNLTVYENEYLNTLMYAKNFINNENYEEALKLVLSIDEDKKFFSKWVKQVKIYLEFKSLVLGAL